MNFCSECGTSVYLVPESQYRYFVAKREVHVIDYSNRKTNEYFNYRKSPSPIIKNVICDVCSKKFRSEIALAQHKKAKHHESSTKEEAIDTEIINDMHSTKVQSEMASAQHKKAKHHESSAKEEEEAIDTEIINDMHSTKVQSEMTLAQQKKVEQNKPSAKKKVIDKKFICVRCFSKFDSQYCLTKHQMLVHYKFFYLGAVARQCRDMEDIYTEMQQSSECFVCKHCGKEFSTKKLLGQHRSSFRCMYCGKEYSTKKDFLEHVIEYHPLLLNSHYIC